jgi:hypothetical protein
MRLYRKRRRRGTEGHAAFGYLYAAAGMVIGFHAQEARLILGHHRIDGVRHQVQKHLLQLNSISYYLRQLFILLRLDQYPMLL